MILAPTLTLNTPARGYDADATAFAAASGATDVAALSAFVKGIKELGLWNNMVCWPLRSSQNAGTGDTVYSLSGLGTFNGTRVNGPAWTADGLDFAGTSPAQRITVNSLIRSNYSQRSFYAAAQIMTGTTAFGGERGLIMVTYAAPLNFGAFDSLSGMGFGGINLNNQAGSTSPASLTSYSSSASGIVINQRNTHAVVFSAPNLTSYKNGSFNAGNTLSGAPATISDQAFVMMDDGQSVGFGQSKGVVSFAMDFHGALTAAQVGALDSLYRSTLGTGLGLP